ncbi:MAG: methyltransferase domain-containing protein, partial [Candidatus Firestonebacteria bacterium]
GVLTEEWKDVTYKISPMSFFQTNTSQMKTMYDLVRSLVTGDPKAEACDLYCGAGTMTVFLADKFRKIIGVDEVKSAIFDARTNFELNKKGDCEFLHGRVEDILLNSLETGYKAKTVILDPPRKGCERIVLTNLKKIGAEEIIYVSCDIATLARDLGVLASEGYEIESVQPLDMFPNTFHVENVVKLRSKGSALTKPAQEKTAVIKEQRTAAVRISKPEPKIFINKSAPVKEELKSEPKPFVNKHLSIKEELKPELPVVKFEEAAVYPSERAARPSRNKHKFDGRKFQGDPNSGKGYSVKPEKLPGGRTQPGPEYKKKIERELEALKYRRKPESKPAYAKKPGGYGRRFEESRGDAKPWNKYADKQTGDRREERKTPRFKGKTAVGKAGKFVRKNAHGLGKFSRSKFGGRSTGRGPARKG